jgi:YD repeat-containing protein
MMDPITPKPLGSRIVFLAAVLAALVVLGATFPSLVQAGNDDQCGSNCNRDNKSSLEIGDPIMAASGALRFNIPLLDLGGPMNLHFTVMYGSDYVNWVKYDLAFANAGNGRFWWSPGCAAYMSDTLYQFWLDDFRQVAFDPTTKEVDTSNEPQSVGYQLETTDDHAFVMDPVRDLVYVFDKTDKLIREVQDRNGNTLSYTYDENDRLESISDGLGRELHFTYSNIDERFVITRVTDQAGREIDFSYEASGEDNNNLGTLRSITDALNQTTTFAYTPTNFITGVTYPENNTPYTQEWEEKAIYDNSFAWRVTKQTDAYDNETTLDYNNTTDQVTETTPENDQVVYEHFDHHAPPKGLTDAEDNALTLAKNDRN